MTWLLLAEAGVPEGGLFDLDATLPLMAVQVVLLTFLLNSLFFRPVGKVVEDREGYIATSRADAKQKLAQVERLEADLAEQLKGARQAAQAVIVEAEQEVDRLYREALAKAEAEDGAARSRKVVNISSIGGLFGNAGQIGYASGKTALIGLTKTLAKEWGRYNVNVNCVAFGLIQTRMTETFEDGKPNLHDVGGKEIPMGVPPEFVGFIKKMIPLGRPGTPEDAANAVYLFCTPESDYISGEVVLASGGLVI